MNTKIIAAILVASIVAMATVVPMAMGDSQVDQEVTVTKVATFDIRNQTNAASIANISFSGASGSTDSAPTNDVDATAQDLATNTSVAVIKNTGDVPLAVYLTADGDDDFKALVSAERAEVAATAAGSLSKTLSDPWGTAVNADETIAVGDNQKLFLQADLQGSGSSAGGSLTVEGEA